MVACLCKGRYCDCLGSCFHVNAFVCALQKELPSKTDCPHMCAYKLVTVKFKWFGLQNRVESFIHKVWSPWNRGRPMAMDFRNITCSWNCRLSLHGCFGDYCTILDINRLSCPQIFLSSSYMKPEPYGSV